MAWREWLFPLVAGGMAAAMVWFVYQPAPDEEHGFPALAVPFTHAVAAPRLPSQPSLQLAVFETAFPVPPGGETPAADAGTSVTVLHQTPWLAFLPVPSQPTEGVRGPDGAVLFTVEPAPPTAPRFGMDGHNATRLAVYLFTPEGKLMASTDGAAGGRFEVDGDLIPLPSPVWYLGAKETAPAGTLPLPGLVAPFVEPLRPALVGLPDGGVASAKVEHWLYGELYATVQVSDLLREP